MLVIFPSRTCFPSLPSTTLEICGVHWESWSLMKFMSLCLKVLNQVTGFGFCLYRVSPHSPVRLILKTLHQSDVKSHYFKEGIFIVHRVKVVWPLVWTYPRRLQLPEQFEWRDNVLVVFLPVSLVKLLCSWTRCLVPKTSTLNQLVRLKK